MNQDLKIFSKVQYYFSLLQIPFKWRRAPQNIIQNKLIVIWSTNISKKMTMVYFLNWFYIFQFVPQSFDITYFIHVYSQLQKLKIPFKIFHITNEKMLKNPIFDTFVGQLIKDTRYKNYLKESTQKYQIKKYKVANLSVYEIKRMYYTIVEKYSNTKKQPIEKKESTLLSNWMINELKTFVWIAACYSAHNQQQLGLLSKSGWDFLISVFYFKPVEILQFQLLSLLKDGTPKNPKKWSEEQNELLKEILKDRQLDGKWNEISKQFFFRSGKKYFRKSQKCREHWFNHLNPAISHDCWSFQQDLELIELVNKLNKKWAEISILLGGHRTQHMVKNRYKSLQKKFEKEIVKSGEKKLTRQMLLKTFEINPISLKIQEQPNGDSFIILETNPSKFKKDDQVSINIEQALYEQSKFQIPASIQSQSKLNDQEIIIQINEEKFIDRNSISKTLMNDLDDNEKYIQSFFF